MSVVVQVSTPGSPSSAFASAVTAGNRVIALVSQRDNTGGYAGPIGFDFIAGANGDTGAGNNRAFSIWEYLVDTDTTLLTVGGDSKTYQSAQTSDRMALIEITTSASVNSVAARLPNPTGNLDAGGSLVPTAGDSIILIGGIAYDGGDTILPYSGVTEFCDDFFSPHLWAGYMEIPVASGGAYTVGATSVGTGGFFFGATAAFVAGEVDHASFTVSPDGGTAPVTVNFTDTSGPGTPTAWAWDFGDGGTSSSQSPLHAYAGHGNFVATLTVTIDGVDYVATHTISVLADVGYTPPPPGLALVEIYATSPGSARWDQANWDEAVWSSDSWQNVTPESTDITIIWGSQRPELGILSTPDAGSWGIGFFDPLRRLDPANDSSPFFGDIVPGLPVRITHRGWVVKQGVLESAGHNFDLNSFQTHNSGYFRVTDSQSLMARSMVPPDTTLGDDLFSRARDAIAAAGLSIRVVPEGFASSPLGDVLPIGHVHDLVPWVTGTEWSVWQWISDAAAQVLHVPYINRTGELGFRQWSLPKDNAKSLRSPNLVGLGSVIFQNGTYSVVTALDDDGVTLRTAEITPKPYYGAVTYDDRATKPTPNAQDWVDAVLADRAVAGLRWVPGEVFPLTANDVRYFAEIEAIERVSIDYVEANPPISVTGIVVGGQIVITPVQEREARWSFLFQVAATEDQPLVDDDSPSDFLVNDDDPTDYLYPG